MLAKGVVGYRTSHAPTVWLASSLCPDGSSHGRVGTFFQTFAASNAPRHWRSADLASLIFYPGPHRRRTQSASFERMGR